MLHTLEKSYYNKLFNKQGIVYFLYLDRGTIELYFFKKIICDYFYVIITIMLASFGIRSCICVQDFYYLSFGKNMHFYLEIDSMLC